MQWPIAQILAKIRVFENRKADTGICADQAERKTGKPGQLRPRSDRILRLERAGKDFVDLIGDFHAEREELVVELTRIVEVKLVAFWGVPEDVVLGVHEIEVGDGEAVVAVEPDCQKGLGSGDLGYGGWAW